MKGMKIELELEYGMLLRAKKRLRTCDRSFNSPSTTHVEKDTVVIIANEGTRRGDVGCKAVGLFNDHNTFVPLPNLSDDFFREGHRTRCPYDKGMVDLTCWELVGHLKGDEFLFFQRQAPHSTNMPLVVINQKGEFKFAVGTWDGWSLVPPKDDLSGIYSTFRTDGLFGTNDCEEIESFLLQNTSLESEERYLVASLRHLSVDARINLLTHLGWNVDIISNDEDILVFHQDDLVTIERWFQRLPFEFEKLEV